MTPAETAPERCPHCGEPVDPYAPAYYGCGTVVAQPEETTSFCAQQSLEIMEALRARVRELEGALKADKEWTEDDRELPEDEEIQAVHPLERANVNPDRFKIYEQALRMVSAKRSKYALVDVLNWALARAALASTSGKGGEG